MSDFKDVLFEFCGEGGREIRDAEIPKTIHRIWVGGKIAPATFENLIQFQERLNQVQTGRTEPWRHILWTTGSTLQNLEAAGQMRDLESKGMEIEDMDTVSDPSNIGKKVKPQIAELMGKKNYKFVSDLWRMYILYTMGGVYMDADIGIGSENFAEPLYHRYQFQGDQYSYMPLLGSVFPFKDIYTETYGDPSNKEKIKKCLEEERDKYKGGYGWNYFYATKQENNVTLVALNELLYHGKDAQTMSLNMIQSFDEDIRKSNDRVTGNELFQYAFAPLHLQYATRASEDKQE